MGQPVKFLSQHHENLFDEMNVDTIGRNTATAYLLSGIMSLENVKFESGRFSELLESYQTKFPHIFQKQTLESMMKLSEDEFVLLQNYISLIKEKKQIEYATPEEKIYIHTESGEKIFE